MPAMVLRRIKTLGLWPFKRVFKIMSDQTFVPAGHYYSPVADREEAKIAIARTAGLQNPAAIDVNDAGQVAFLKRLQPVLSKIKLNEIPSPDHRYYTDNDMYGSGDAAILKAIICTLKPKKVIEIGAGFSSAVMFDARDDYNLKTEITQIEPYPERLKSLLKKTDVKTLNLIDQKIQNVEPAVFRKLEADDILFVDSSHVMKTGSDLNHIIFEILPVINPGVIIHFHDCFWPFEYGAEWAVTQNRSWNEIYALRAFLMHNAAYQIQYFNHYMYLKHRELCGSISGHILKNCGGGLWLRKIIF
jgi:predicted O-methyltransferase YrrM